LHSSAHPVRNGHLLRATIRSAGSAIEVQYPGRSLSLADADPWSPGCLTLEVHLRCVLWQLLHCIILCTSRCHVEVLKVQTTFKLGTSGEFLLSLPTSTWRPASCCHVEVLPATVEVLLAHSACHGNSRPWTCAGKPTVPEVYPTLGHLTWRARPTGVYFGSSQPGPQNGGSIVCTLVTCLRGQFSPRGSFASRSCRWSVDSKTKFFPG
jgi:hypothetical protein